MARLVPRFEKLRAASERTSRVLSRNKSNDTKCERVLRRSLWRLGFRFRKNVKCLPGKPDIVFPRERLAVFCDGDFWHGNNWSKRKQKLESGFNATYWVAKIQANRTRDKRHMIELERLGWRGLRVWESEVLAGPDEVAMRIGRLILSVRIGL